VNSPQIVHLYVSPGHNYFGRHGKPAGAHATEERSVVHCVAGRGIEGDRFFDYKADYKGQVTFFAAEVHERLAEMLGVVGKPVSVFRRNVVTRGLDLKALEQETFELGGVVFQGMGECKPCYWMDTAFGPGAEAALRGDGGLRAKILTSGSLAVGPVPIQTGQLNLAFAGAGAK
jgi:MOSC domain-containing protein YiiM